MRRVLPILSFVLALAVPWGPAGASSAVRLTFEQIVAGSDRVVVAELLSRNSEWGPDHRRIFTTFHLAVTEDLAGRGEDRITIVQPGGTVGRWTQRVHGYPTFRMSEPVLLFLRNQPVGYRVVGLCQGAFAFHRDGRRMLLVQRLEGLRFPGDHGRPILLEQQQAFERIRTIFGSRKAP